MTTQALIFTLASLGISETVYLIKSRMTKKPAVCPIGGNCQAVLTSRYRNMFLIPNDVLGLLFYIASSIITALWVIGIPPVVWWIFTIKLIVLIGSLLSVYFTYLQYRVIKAWCFWCLISAATIWLMGFILLFT